MGDGWAHPAVCPKWLQLMLVCHRWRRVACSTPALWRMVHVQGDSRWLSLALERSGALPIDVILGNHVVFPSAVPILLQHSTRLRRLFVVDADREIYDDYGEVFLWSSTIPWPCLEEVMILHDRVWVEPIELDLDPDLFPKLRSIHLSEAHISWTSPLVQQLVCLRLNNVSGGGTDHTLRQLILALDTCSSLRTLELFKSVPRAGVLTGADHEDLPIASLPQLRSLRLFHDTASDIHILLSHLYIQAHADVEVHLDLYLHSDWPEEVEHGLLNVIPMRPESLAFLHEATSASIHVYSDPCPSTIELDIRTASQSRVYIRLVVESDRYSPPDLPWQYTVDDAAKDFRALFGTSPLRRLAIFEDGTFKPILSSAAISHALQGFKDICTLGFRGDPAMLVDALTGTVTQRGVSHAGDSVELTAEAAAERNIVCAHLRCLKLRSSAWTLDVLSAINECLQVRARHGERLHTLELIRSGSELEDPDTGAARQQTLSALQGVLTGSLVYVDGGHADSSDEEEVSSEDTDTLVTD